MIDHLGIICADLAAARAFYDEVLGVLDARPLQDLEFAVGYGRTEPDFWLEAAEGRATTAGQHFAFTAGSAAQVQAFFRAALALGAEPLHEPQEWPQYHPGYYAAFVRDPDGNNVEAVFHGGGPQAGDVPGPAAVGPSGD